MKWFKLHSEFANDPKMRTFSKCQRYDLVCLMCLASESKERGVILLEDEDVAATLDQEPEEYAEFVAKLTRKGVVERDGRGFVCFRNWDARQYDKPSDRPEAVAERKAAQRVREKNADVTPMSRAENALDTDTESERESETDDRKEKDANANALSAAAPPAKAKKVSSERSEQIGQEAVREYQERYRRAYGTYAEFLQGDAPALKDARMKLGARFVLALDRFFGCANERVKARRHAVKMFCGEINVWLDDAAVSASFPPPLAGARASPAARRNGAYQPTGTLDEQKAAILAQLRE